MVGMVASLIYITLRRRFACLMQQSMAKQGLIRPKSTETAKNTGNRQIIGQAIGENRLIIATDGDHLRFKLQVFCFSKSLKPYPYV
jgi:hypothetical protein